MRISKPTFEQYQTTDRATKKTVKRVRVRWRVYGLADGSSRSCKKSGFVTKGAAEAYVSNCLDKARYGLDGWSLDAKGYPQQRIEPDSEPSVTVFDLVRDYVRTVWGDRASGTRTNKRGRLLMMIGALVDDESMAEAIMNALRANARRELEAKPTLAASVAWYLRHHCLGRPELGEDAPRADLVAARAWIESHSLPLTQVDRHTLTPLRERLTEGTSQSTAKQYWSVISACLAWGTETAMITHRPEAGMVKLRRDPDDERVDENTVPGPADIADIAAAVAERAGRHAKDPDARNRAERAAHNLVIVAAYCALRLGEAVALRRSDVEFADDGGAWITVETQDNEQVAADSDDGATTLATTPTKGHRSRRAARRRIYLAPSHTAGLRELLDSDVGPEPDARLFRNRSDRPINKQIFRKEIWGDAIGALYEPGHRLAGATPHTLRSAGMTFWLQSNVPFKRMQRMGGWKSLKVMLDVYAAFLPDDTEVAVAAINSTDTPDPAVEAVQVKEQIRALEQRLAELTEHAAA